MGSHFAVRIDPRMYQSYLVSRRDMDLTVFPVVQKITGDIEPDVIVHMGGLVNLTRDFDVAKRCIDANISGTLHLLEAIRSHVPKLFIYVSTEEIYGEAQVPYKEDSLPTPPSPYAMTKLAGEHLCNMYGKYLGFPVIILRVSTMYGPKDSINRFIPSIICKALHGQDIPLNSGKKLRDYVFVEDVADALLACLDWTGKQNTEVVNIGGGKSYTLKSVVEKIVRLCQSTSSVRFGVFPDRMLESDVWKMDIERAKNILHWVPRTPLEEGLLKTIEYYKKI